MILRGTLPHFWVEVKNDGAILVISPAGFFSFHHHLEQQWGTELASGKPAAKNIVCVCGGGGLIKPKRDASIG